MITGQLPKWLASAPAYRFARIRAVSASLLPSRIEAGRLFDADLARDHLHRLIEAGHRLLGFEDVEDEKAVLRLRGRVDQHAVEWQIRERVEAALTVRKSADNLLV